MRYQCTTTIEEILGASATILEMAIGDKPYTMHINNSNNKATLDFVTNAARYQVRIEARGISFCRDVIRPHHDHDDVEQLYRVTGPVLTQPDYQVGDLVWEKNTLSGLTRLYIPFGPKKED